MKTKILTFFALIISVALFAQENIFLKRDYWKSNPSINEVEATIAKGNDITELNRHYFDGPTYAILEKVNKETIAHIITKEGNGIDKLTHDGRIYLHWAAYAGNLELVDYLLQQGSDASAIDAHGYSVINFAANTGGNNTKIYDALLDKGADIKATNHSGANALLLASSGAKSFEIIQYFADKGLSLQHTDNYGNGVFQYAARSGNVALLKTLVAKGSNYKSLNDNGENAMFMAAQGTRSSQNKKDVFDYLEGLGLSNQLTNKDGKNLLHLIARRNKDLSLFNHFIDAGLSVGLKDKEGITPLMNAASSNDLQVVELLVKHTKNINTVDEKGRSALMFALERNEPEVVAFLIEQGADITSADKESNTAAYYLIQSYNPREAKQFNSKLALLQKAGLKLNDSQNNGNTLLHLAAKENNLALLKRLEEFGIDINAKNAEGNTALHLAAMSTDDGSILTYLINKGADKTVKTDFEETVYDLALENELLKQQQIELDFLKL